ncbi:MAG: M14 family zinc carboxypeptidase [Gemmatimonadota bacterium]
MVRILFVFLLAAAPAFAQHGLSQGGSYDPAVPTPRAVLGYEIGQHFTPHHLIVLYAERLAAASRRVHVDTVAHSFEGRPVLQIAITSEASQSRLSDIERESRAFALLQADERATIARLPVIVWLGYTVHGGEASGTEAALAVMYQLAAGQDAETRMILDSTVVLIDPVQNPDGHERHVSDVSRAHGALWVPPAPVAMIHQGNWPGPRTSHYYFDLNRDWFLLSHPETRGRIASLLRWYPHTAVDLHEMGSSSTYYFSPPMEPVNVNVTQNLREWWNIYAAGNAAAFDARGWPFFRREGYDEFYPGYGTSWPLYLGTVGMTYEEASSSGGAIRRNDGTILTLRDAASRHYTASLATLSTSARRRTERLRDFVEFRKNAVAAGQRARIRGIAIARDPHGRADSLATLLRGNGIVLQRTRTAASLRDAAPFETASGTQIPAGSWIVDFAQPNGVLARALLEPNAELDSVFIREELESRETGQGNRFYDVTAWSMPYTFGVKAWTLGAIPAGAELAVDVARQPATFSNARVAYAFEPGSEASMRLVAALLADSVRVHFAQRWFRSGEHLFEHGAFVVRLSANDASVHDKVRKHTGAAAADVYAINSSAVDAGTDLGSNSVVPVRAPRVALVGGPGFNGSSFGFAWYAFDQRIRLPITTINASSLGSGAINEFNVIVMPSAGNLDNVINESARGRLADWVRNGGVLVTLDGATSWIANEKLNLVRLRARRDTTRADNQPGAALPAAVPGAIVRLRVDTLSMLTAGIDENEIAGLIFSDRVYRTPNDVRPGEVVLRYAPQNRLRIAGYLWPEVPARLADSPYLWTERVGSGRVIAFASDPNFRDMWRGMLPLFANAVLLGGSF